MELLIALVEALQLDCCLENLRETAFRTAFLANFHLQEALARLVLATVFLLFVVLQGCQFADHILPVLHCGQCLGWRENCGQIMTGFVHQSCINLQRLSLFEVQLLIIKVVFTENILVG